MIKIPDNKKPKSKFNRNATVLDLNKYLNVESFNKTFLMNVLKDIHSRYKSNSVTLIVSLDKLNLLSHYKKLRALTMIELLLEYLITTGNDDEDKDKYRNIRNNLLTQVRVAVDNSVEHFMFAMEFFDFSSKFTIISNPGSDNEKKSFHIPQVISDTIVTDLELSIFQFKRLSTYGVKNVFTFNYETVFNKFIVEEIKNMLKNKESDFTINIFLSGKDKINEIIIEHVIANIGLLNFKQILNTSGNIVLTYSNINSYELDKQSNEENV